LLEITQLHSDNTRKNEGKEQTSNIYLKMNKDIYNMKNIFFIILICLLAGGTTNRLPHKNNGNQHVFLLGDNDDSKTYLNDSVKTYYKKGTIINSPLIAIDGIVFKYNMDQDTIYLPIKKMDISVISYLDKSSSSVIYGKNETNGAIIINTVDLK